MCGWTGCPRGSCLISRPAAAVKVASGWTNDLDRGEDRGSVGLWRAQLTAKRRAGQGLGVLPRCLACGLDESRPCAGGCACHLLLFRPGGLPGGDHGAVGGLALGGEVAFGGADRRKGV